MYPTERRRSFQYYSNLKLSTHIRPPLADSYSPEAKETRRSAEDETVTNSLRTLLLNGNQTRSAHSRDLVQYTLQYRAGGMLTVFGPTAVTDHHDRF